jgi:ATP-binding cassette, subfamily C, bacterial EexD
MKQVQTELELALAAMRQTFLVVGVFSFFINLLLLTAPLYMLQLFDRVLSSRNTSTLVALTVIAVLMLVVMGLLETIRSRVLVRVSARLNERLANRVFSATF